MKHIIKSGDGYVMSLRVQGPEMTSDPAEAMRLELDDAIGTMNDMILSGYSAQVEWVDKIKAQCVIIDTGSTKIRSLIEMLKLATPKVRAALKDPDHVSVR